jgi:hypothetical protein
LSLQLPTLVACPACGACFWVQVRVQGSLRLPSGDVNLVATQLALDRDHANLITFQQEQSGIDPLVDLVMSGGDLRVAIKVGRGWWGLRS